MIFGSLCCLLSLNAILISDHTTNHSTSRIIVIPVVDAIVSFRRLKILDRKTLAHY